MNYAANWAEVDEIKEYLDTGGQPNWTNDLGSSLLSIAAAGTGPPPRRLKVVKMLQPERIQILNSLLCFKLRESELARWLDTPFKTKVFVILG